MTVVAQLQYFTNATSCILQRLLVEQSLSLGISATSGDVRVSIQRSGRAAFLCLAVAH